jgi:hypothetical protein
MSPFPSNTSRSLDADPVLMRRAADTDAARIRALAQLDDKRLPAGPFLVADVAGEIVAALSLPTGTVVADPFRLTSDVVAMLRLRVTQMSVVPAAPAERRAPRTASGRTQTAAVTA